MLGRLFSKLFGRKSATASTRSRPVSPPSPVVESPPPPPPPPPPSGVAPPRPQPLLLAASPKEPSPDEPDAPSGAAPPVQPLDYEPGSGRTGGVRIILEDGTLAEPILDPELEERLRYIVDNIVPPSDAPPA